MSRFQALAKMLGIAAEDVAKLSPEVLNTLEKVNTPEISTALKGAEREQYLNALDSAYGPQDARRKRMDFSADDQFHGTKFNDDQIAEFRSSGTKRGDIAKYGTGVYTTPNPELANMYADQGAVYPVAIKNKKVMLPDDLETAKSIIETSGKNVDPSDLKGLRSTEEALHLVKNKLGKKEYTTELDKQGYRTVSNNGDILVSQPQDVRSKFAAFDPRFKDSTKLLAGTGAVPMAPEFDPIGQVGEILEPITSRYEKLKAMITNPLAKTLDLTKDGSATEGIQTALDIGADPVNFIPGAPGLAIGAAQMLGNSKKKENK